MKVQYRNPVVQQIRKEITRAKGIGFEIEYIELTAHEWCMLRDYVRNEFRSVTSELDIDHMTYFEGVRIQLEK